MWYPECEVARHGASAISKYRGTGQPLCSAHFLLNLLWVTAVCKAVLPTFKVTPPPHRYARGLCILSNSKFPPSWQSRLTNLWYKWEVNDTVAVKNGAAVS